MNSKEPAAWKIQNSELYADCRVFKVFKKHLEHEGDGRSGDFFLMEMPDWVMALALTPDRRLILVNQYRFGSRSLSWELAGGVMDPGEKDPVAAARRELLEETGYVSARSRYLGWCYPNPAIQQNRSHFVLFEDCTQEAHQELDMHEDIQVGLFELSQVNTMVKTSQISHCIAVTALFFLKDALDGR